MTRTSPLRRTAIAALTIAMLGFAYGLGQSSTSAHSDGRSRVRIVVSKTVIRADNGILLPTGTEFRLEDRGEHGATLELTLLASREALGKHFRESTEVRDFQTLGYAVLDTE